MNKDDNIFKKISEYDGKYEINKSGTIVRSLFTKEYRILKLTICSGYSRIKLCKKGVVKDMYIHRLVAITFIRKIIGKAHVDHKDGNKLNNHVDNLRWVTGPIIC